MEHDKQVIIVHNKEECIKKIINLWKTISEESIEERGRFNVALSGGSTPRDLYKAISKEYDIDWHRTHIYQVDERYVPKDSLDNNYRMIERNLVSKIHIPAGNFHFVDTAITPITKCAKQYAVEVEKVKRFDLVILGLGEDGHTASLFSGHPVLNESEKKASEVVGLENKDDRITLTFPVINKAANIIFFVVGKGKQKIVSNVLGCDPVYPASHVKPEDGYLYFVIDECAAQIAEVNLANDKAFNRFPY